MSVGGVLAYLKARVVERSTWIVIAGAITVAAALPWPWSLFSVIAGSIGALVPDGPVK